MLNRLRWKLTLLSTLLTGPVLVAALSFAYHLTRSQYLRACEMEFFGSVDTVQYQWNRFKILEDSYLYQMHTQQHIAFYLEETGMPLLHSLHVTEPTLIDAAKAAAQMQAGMDCAKAPIAGLSVMQADFPLHFSSTLYRCAARIDLQENGQ